MSKSLSSRIHLKQKLYGYAMNSRQSIERNVDEFLKIIADLENVDVLISDEDQAVMLLMALPRQFDGLKDTLRYSKSALTLTDVVTAIKSKELESEFLVKSPKKNADVLHVKGKENSKWSKQEEKSQNAESKNKYGKEKTRPKKVCWLCGEQGHFKMQCPKRNNDNGRGNYQHGETAMVNRGDAVRVDMLYVGEALNMTDSNLETRWIIDSGCSFHMTWKKESFISLDESLTGTVRMANDTISQVMGQGSVKIENEDGSMVILTKGRYIPEMKRNLIYLGTLEAKGCRYISEGGVLKIFRDERMLLQGRRHDTPYFLCEKETDMSISTCNEVKEDDTHLRHSRMGHMSQRGLNILIRRNLLDGKKISSLTFCEDCIYGKTHRLKFPMGKHISVSILHTY